MAGLPNAQRQRCFARRLPVRCQNVPSDGIPWCQKHTSWPINCSLMQWRTTEFCNHAHYKNGCFSLHVIVFPHILFYRGKGARVTFKVSITIPYPAAELSESSAHHPLNDERTSNETCGQLKEMFSWLWILLLWHLLGSLEDFTSHKKKQRQGERTWEKIPVTSQKGTGFDMLSNMPMVF